MSARIRLSYARDEKTPPNIFSDHDWLRQNQDELLVEYGERFIVIYQGTVLGTGKTYKIAVQNAEQNLPQGDDEITPVVEWLGKRHPFFRVHPGPTQPTSSDNAG